MRPAPEPVQVVKQRRDAALQRLVASVPYIRHLGVVFDRRGDELTAQLVYSERLIGNPALPALHGGAIGAFLEITAIMELAWAMVWERMEGGGAEAARIEAGDFPPLPKTIDITIDYLRSGLPRDAYARARVNRSGRRYASVHVEAWQDNRARLFAQATGHFLMPQALED
jgi:acyl-coenzyme A thioesterase PaaI-like protein